MFFSLMSDAKIYILQLIFVEKKTFILMSQPLRLLLVLRFRPGIYILSDVLMRVICTLLCSVG